jgi:hypothetical protein
MRILQLSTYPLAMPRHGGQIRAAELRRVMEAAGHEVRSIAVYPAESYGGAAVGDNDVAFPVGSAFRNPSTPYLSDVDAGRYLAGDADAYSRFCKAMHAYQPDIVMLEQCFLWPAVRRYLGENPGRTFKLVYSSQNMESELKREVLRGVPEPVVTSAVREIAMQEAELAQAAHLQIACTDADAYALKNLGARNVLVAANGSSRKSAGEQTLRNWKDHLKDTRFALFVGSGHPPNANGFWTMFAPSLAFLAPDQCVIAVGGVGTLLPRHEAFKHWDQINASRLRCPGMLEDESLAALLALATCVVLPITGGGGSNIKTAEALINAKVVIGTSASFRGYAGVDRLAGVYRADEPIRFRRLVKAALDGELAGCAAGNADREAFLWTSTLSNVSIALESA